MPRSSSMLAVPLLLLSLDAYAEPPPPLPPPTKPTAPPASAQPATQSPSAPPPAYDSPAAPSSEQPGAWLIPPCDEPEAEGEVRLSTGCSGVFGLRGSVVHVKGASAGEGAGLMFSAEGEEYVRRGLFSARGLHRLALGGGGAGFEGALLGDLAFGVRIPVSPRHGPVIRAGGLGYILGDDAFYGSLLDLPRLELGYQYMRGHTLLELGGTTGVVLAGRYRGGDAPTRAVGHGFEVGAYAAVQVPWVRFGAAAMELPTDDGWGSAVDVMQGTLCAIAAPLAICADGRMMQSRATFPAAAPQPMVTTLYAGLSFGVTRER